MLNTFARRARLFAGLLLLSTGLNLTHAAPQAAELYSREQLSQSLDSCAHLFPGGTPLRVSTFPAVRQVTGLCSDHFAVLYSAQAKSPLVAVERLNRAQLLDAKGEERSDRFFADPRLKAAQRASLKDFKGAKKDRGHLAAAGNQPNARSMAQSFALTNMVAQDPTNNQVAWNKLEDDTRKYVMRARGDVFVFTGPLFLGPTVETIGKGQVWVPSHLFKLVYDATTGKAWAHVVANTSTARLGPPMSYDSFVGQTGFQFIPAQH